VLFGVEKADFEEYKSKMDQILNGENLLPI